MPLELRLTLFFGAAGTLIYFLKQIKKARLQIDYTISWSLLCGTLVLLSLFPSIVISLCGIFKISSPANLVYLLIIFVLLLKQFTLTIKVSKMNHQILELAQHIALKEQEQEHI